MYADDTTLLCAADSPATLESELQSNMLKIADWFNDNNLTLNIKKTKLMIFGSRHTLDLFNGITLHYDNEIIEKVDKFKYLGVIFDPLLSWSEHIHQLSVCISKRCGVISRVKHYVPKDILIMLANAIAIPNFDYCSPIWSNCSKNLTDSLQVLHNRLARIILSADIRTPTNDMMSDLKWIKLKDRWNNQMLTIMFKCLKGLAPMYLSSQFTFVHSIHTKSTRSQTSNALYVPSWKNNAGKRTFHTRVSEAWNILPANIRQNYNNLSLSQLQNATLVKME
jgi:hypothetical protein